MKCKCSKAVIKIDSVEKVRDMIDQNNGFITSAQATEAGLPRRVLSRLADESFLYRAERGVYILPETWEDEMYYLQHRYAKGIYSNETALYLHGLSDRTPQTYTMTFPHGYNAAGLRTRNVKLKFVNPEAYGLGITEKPSPFGNKLRIYNAERTLCDILKGSSSCDIQIINQAMKAYVKSKEKDLSRLFDYSEKLRVKPKMLRYMEVLL